MTERSSDIGQASPTLPCELRALIMLSALSVTTYARLPRAACFDAVGRSTRDTGAKRESAPAIESGRADVTLDRAA